MLNFAICEDNINILNRMSNTLEDIFIKNNFDASISIKSNTPDAILTAVREKDINVLILDINLNSKINGLELAEKVREINKDMYFVFATSHLEYALIAYKHKTFDYLPKPITRERLEDTIVRLFKDIHGIPKKYIKIDSKNTVVLESDIEYIKRDGMKLIFHTNSIDYDTYSSFNKFKDNLPSHFVRCHKSFVVNTRTIKNANLVSNLITLNDNSICYIGPKYKKSFVEVLKANALV